MIMSIVFKRPRDLDNLQGISTTNHPRIIPGPDNMSLSCKRGGLLDFCQLQKRTIRDIQRTGKAYYPYALVALEVIKSQIRCSSGCKLEWKTMTTENAQQMPRKYRNNTFIVTN